MGSTSDARLESLDNLGLAFPEQLRGKKILLATESFGPVNGVSKTTLNLVNYLRSQGVIIAVVAPEISTGAEQAVLSTSNPNDIEVRLTGYPLPYNPELSVVYPVRLSALYQRTFGATPDLIYLASPASLGFQILLQLRQQRNPVPVLLNFQTDLSGYCEILFPSPLDNWAVWVFRRVQGYLFRHACVKTVFYPSMFVREYLKKAGVQGEKMMNLRRGVNCDIFHPSKRDENMRKMLAPNGELIIVSVCRLALEKGFEFLSQVAERLEAQKFPFKLLIVGGNRSRNVEEEIYDMFGNLREGTVSFTGMLKGEDLARAYAAGDLFLHCSITETFGLVVLESMASGVPVIARDEGGPSEIVADGQSGFLVPPNDLDGFVEKVLKIGKDGKLRTQMAIESRKMAEEATWEKINNQVAWKLAEALGRPQLSHNAMPSFAIPVYSWLLLSPELRSLLISLVVDVRLAGGIGIIIGVWGGLVITWILVQVTLLFRTRAPWVLDRLESVTQ